MCELSIVNGAVDAEHRPAESFSNGRRSGVRAVAYMS